MPNAKRSNLSLGGALALIALVTVLPTDPAPGGVDIRVPDAADFALNLALFVPLGLTLSGRFAARWQGVGFALALSTGIELLQLFVIPGRTASPWDLLANTLGAGAGAYLPLLLLALPPALVWLGSPLLLAPTPPSASQWWGQWAHHFSGTRPFTGVIEAVGLNGVATPDHQLSAETTSTIRDRYLRGPLSLHVDLLPRGDSTGLRHLAGVADGQGRTVIAVWQRGTALETTWFARGTASGLRPPGVRATKLLSLPAGQPAIVRTAISGGRWTATVETAGADRSSSLWLGPWQGWRLFWPLPPPDTTQAWLLCTAWSLLCLAPLAGVLASSRK